MRGYVPTMSLNAERPSTATAESRAATTVALRGALEKKPISPTSSPGVISSIGSRLPWR
jgi:hypothetical protein